MSNIKEQLKAVEPLAKIIKRHESNDDYEAVWGGIKSYDRPRKPITEMTVREVLAWQDSIDKKYMSEAAGAWQIMEDTLRGLYRQAGVSLDDLYNKETQDKLALQLMKRRGLDDYISDKATMNAKDFANSLAKEWASLPVVTPLFRGDVSVAVGDSYYSGVAGNKALTTPEEVLEAVYAIKESKAKAEVEPRKSTVQTKTGKAGLGGATVGGGALVASQLLPEDFNFQQALVDFQEAKEAIGSLQTTNEILTFAVVVLSLVCVYLVYNRRKDKLEGRA